MKITIILPTFNEKANLKKMIPLLEEEVLPKIKKHQVNILVADDNSPDGTAEVVLEFSKKWSNIHLLKGEKRGLGAAYIRAMRYAMDHLQADAVIEFDADFQHNPHDIPRLIAGFDEGYDYVIGSRYVKGGSIPKEWGLHRKFMSFFGSLFARIMFLTPHVHDLTSGYKLTKTSFLNKVDLENLYSKYYAYKIHILHDILKLGAKVKEVPIVFYERREGSSKISRKDLFDSFYVVVRLRLHDSKQVIKFLIVGGFGFILNALALRLLVEYSRWAPAPANLVGAALAIFSNYNLNNLWTFRERKTQDIGSYLKKLLQFYATSASGVIVIQTGTIFLGDILIGRQYYFIYFLIGTFFLLIWNFTVYNLVIWRKAAQ